MKKINLRCKKNLLCHRLDNYRGGDLIKLAKIRLPRSRRPRNDSWFFSGFVLVLFLFLALTGCTKKVTTIKVDLPLENNSANVNNDQNNQASTTDADLPEENNISTTTEVSIPTTLDLGVPFVSQAPLRDWSMPYQEACEEASMISVAKFYNHSATDSQTINRELLAVIDWEGQNGYDIDINAGDVVKVLKSYFKLPARVETNITVNLIKYELSQGHPIIVPTAGRMLGNPYFTGAGPIYHMLVIRGYDEKNFITNDVGTNTKGEKFKYSYQTILDSIHDWDYNLADGGMTEEEMRQGRKVMIVVGE